MTAIGQDTIDKLYERLYKEAREGGYNINPDSEFAKSLVEGLIVNEGRYGYQACPCRLSSGEKSLDLDIICPCDYRDADLTDHGACYCALYVSDEIVRGEKQAGSIPERRPVNGASADHHEEDMEPVLIKGLSFPVWRCKVCGYLCARPAPPGICPICKVTSDRFERFA